MSLRSVVNAMILAVGTLILFKDFLGIFRPEISFENGGLVAGLYYFSALVLLILVVAFLILRRKRLTLLKNRPAKLQAALFASYWCWIFCAAFLDNRLRELSVGALLILLIVSLAVILGGELFSAITQVIRVSALASIVVVAFGFGIQRMQDADLSGLGILDFRVMGVFSHPNVLGAVMAVGVILEVFSTRSSWTPFWTVVFLMLLLASQSAGAVGALIVSIAYFSVWRISFFAKPRQRWLAISLSAAGLLILVVGLADRISTAGSFTSGRTLIWLESLRLAKDSLLLGSGRRGLNFDGFNPVHAHSDIVQALVYGGIPAVLLLVGAIGLALFRVFTRQICLNSAQPALIVFVVILGAVEIPVFPAFSIMSLVTVSAFLGSDFSAPQTTAPRHV